MSEFIAAIGLRVGASWQSSASEASALQGTTRVVGFPETPKPTEPPMNQSAFKPPVAAEAPPRVRAVKPRILCVDDEPEVLHGLQMHLRSRFEVITACGGLEALQYLWELGADSFAAVLSDMRMPGMDGSTLLSHVRRMSPDTTRVMLTGYSEMRSAIAAINDGNVFRFLIKPCDPSVVAQTMVDAVDHYRLVVQDRDFMVSKLHALSTRLRSAERLAAVGTLAGAMAEELNLLARKLDGVIESAPRRGESWDSDALRTLGETRDELHAKVRGLRNVEVPGALPTVPVDLSEVAISALDVLRGAGLTRGVRIDLRASKSVANVMVERAHLERIIIVLLNNAIDATENDSECARYVSVAVSADPVESRVSFVVEDNGSGLPSDRLEALFRGGQDAASKGPKAEHRLSTIRQLIEARGGHMWVSSVRSGGTTVGFELPRAAPVGLSGVVPDAPPRSSSGR